MAVERAKTRPTWSQISLSPSLPIIQLYIEYAVCVHLNEHGQLLCLLAGKKSDGATSSKVAKPDARAEVLAEQPDLATDFIRCVQ